MTIKKWNISQWAVEKKHLTQFFMAVIVIAGIFCATQIGQKEDPDFVFRVAIAEIYWPGASTREIEKQIITPLETYLQEIPWLNYLESTATPGKALFSFYIRGDAPSKEIPQIWYQMRKIFTDRWSMMPRGALGPFVNDEYGDTFIMLYALTGERYTTSQLANLGKNIRQQLRRVPGVQKVNLMGEIPEQLTIALSQDKMQALGLSLFSLQKQIQDHISTIDNGVIDSTALRWPLYTHAGIYSPADIKNLTLVRGGHLVALKDMANVYREQETPLSKSISFQGKPAVILGIVMKKGENILTVTHALGEKISLIQKNLPIGMHLQIVSNQEDSVRSYIRTFLVKLFFAILIILSVTLLSLGFRTGLVVAFSIPIVLAATFIVMNYCGIDFQKISLGALIISLGLLVDDSVISAEMITRKLEDGWTILRAVGHSYETTAFPMLTGTLITVAGFIPIGFAKSSAGEYVFSLFVVVAVSLLISWIVSVYFTPYISYELLKKQTEKIKTKATQAKPNVHLQNCVTWCLEHRGKVITATIVIFLGSIVALVEFVPQQFFPASNRLEIIVDLWSSHNASVKETRKQAQKFQMYLNQDPTIKEKIDNISTYIGQGAPRFYMPLDQQKPEHDLIEFVILPKDIAGRDLLADKITHLLKTKMNQVRSRLSLLNSGPPVGWPIQIRVSGPDRLIMNKIVARIKEVIQGKDIVNIFDTSADQIIALQFVPDRDKLRAYNVDLQTLQATIRYATQGLPVGELRQGDKRIPILVKDEGAQSPTRLKSIFVQSTTGRWVSLKDLGHWVFSQEENKIIHRNGVRTVWINAQVSDKERVNSIARALDKKIDAIRKTLPVDYRIEIGGSIEESEISQHSVYVRLPLLILATLFLLMIHLQDFRKAMMVYITAPLGIIGCSMALLITRQPFGFVSLLGLIALSGMIMRNSIILVDQIDQDTAQGISLREAILGSTMRRFRPIVLTAVAAILAFIPLSFNLFWGPMAIALIGGLAVATFLTVTFLPALYAHWFHLPTEHTTPQVSHDV